MDTTAVDDLSGRIEAIARALLHTVAALETQGLIDGPRLANEWRIAAPRETVQGAETTRRTLLALATALDDARGSRQAQGRR